LTKTDKIGVFLSDGCQLFDDEEIIDGEIVHEKTLFLGEEAPKETLSVLQGTESIYI
jgi:hypothetical protein